MTNKTIFGALVGLSLLAGCAAPAWLGGTSKGDLSLSVRPAVSGEALEAYRVQAPASYAYTKSQIDHVALKLFRVIDESSESAVVVNGSPVAATYFQTNLSQNDAVTFRNLHQNTTYRIKAFAYNASAESSASLISVDASSSVVVAIGLDPAIAIVSVPVQLKSREFSATATSSVVVTDGGVTGGDEVITPGSPPPLTTDLLVTGTDTTIAVNGQGDTDGFYDYVFAATGPTMSVIVHDNATVPIAANDNNSSSVVTLTQGGTASLTVTVVSGHSSVRVSNNNP